MTSIDALTIDAIDHRCLYLPGYLKDDEITTSSNEMIALPNTAAASGCSEGAERLAVVEGEVKSLREDVKTMMSKNELMEATLLKNNLTIGPGLAPNSASDQVNAAAGPAKKNPNGKKKRNRRRRKLKTNWGRAANWGCRNLTKIAAGSLCVAMVLSVAIVWGVIGGASPPLRKRNYGGTNSFSAKSNEIEDPAKITAEDEMLVVRASTSPDKEIIQVRDLRAEVSSGVNDLSISPSRTSAPSGDPAISVAVSESSASLDPFQPSKDPIIPPQIDIVGTVTPTTLIPVDESTVEVIPAALPTTMDSPTSISSNSLPAIYPPAINPPTESPIDFWESLSAALTPTCSATEPCDDFLGNQFCNFNDEFGTSGSCQQCPDKKFTCHDLDLPNNEAIADCALQCDDGLMCWSNNEVCGCSSELQSDYRGSIHRSKSGHECKPWNELDDSYWNGMKVDSRTHDLVENFCRNPDNDTFAWCEVDEPVVEGGYEHCDVPVCDPCSCEEPECGDIATLESCHCTGVVDEIANRCCPKDADDHQDCNCKHRMAACRKSLQYGGGGDTDYCDGVIEECCNDRGEECKCNLLEPICNENPHLVKICNKVPTSCCHYPWTGSDEVTYDWLSSECQCDFYKYAEKSLGIRDYFADKTDACLKAQDGHGINKAADRAALEGIYESTNGEHWVNKVGWFQEEIHHCDWFGITCNGERLVIEMNLTGNNLTGTLDETFSDDGMPLPVNLESLILKKNNLSGPPFGSNGYFLYRQLKHVDISQNNFSGKVDILVFPAAEHLDFSQNKLTSIKQYKRFSPAYEGLRIVDLSNNMIKQNISDIFDNIPPNIEELILSNNEIEGRLPQNIPLLPRMTRLAMGNNNMNGTLPDIRRSLLQLRILDLSNQKGIENDGFTGPIPAGLSNRNELTELHLANNSLGGKISSYIGSLPVLKTLDLSNNEFTGSIPSELGKLGDFAEMVDISNNDLEGQIPSELANFHYAEVRIRGNDGICLLGELAPLSLCGVPGFDLRNDTRLCPPERNALKVIYESSKGQEWTHSDLWLNEYAPHCDWYHVTCDVRGDLNTTTRLELHSNGLSGQLNESIAALSSIQVLDLSDNDIKGSIPDAIGSLSNLIILRLSYNVFVGTMPYLGNLTHLERIHLHGNRLNGTIHAQELKGNSSSFIADCGAPSIFRKALECENCTMCCNSFEECYPNEETNIQKIKAPGFENYLQFTWVFFVCIIGLCCVLHLASFMYNEYKNHTVPVQIQRRRSAIHREKDYALDAIGTDSVYQFFLGTSWWGWMIALAVMGFQIGVMYVFVQGAEVFLEEDNKDLVYTWKCPRSEYDCRDTNDLDWRGWFVFGVLMAAHLLKDIANGSKLIILSAKQGHVNHRKLRFFIGGLLLTAISSFTLYVSTIYNEAIATSNTDIIANSVIILFVIDVDEMFHGVLMAINPRWVESECTSGEGARQRSTFNLTTENSELKDEVQRVKDENLEMKQKSQKVEREMEKLRQKMLQIEERMRLSEPAVAPPDDSSSDTPQ